MSKIPTNITLTVADYFVKIYTEENLPIYFEEGYAHFVQLEEVDHYDAVVLCKSGLPNETEYSGEVIFDAVLDGNRLWQVIQTASGRAFVVFNPRNYKEIQQVAFLSDDSKNWTIHSKLITSEDASFLSPLTYPMGALVLYYLTVNSNAFMIHASGIWDGETGRIFSGFSGVGKSTMAKLWEEEGAHVVNDDRLIIREVNGETCRSIIYNDDIFDISSFQKLNQIFHLEFPVRMWGATFT